MGQVNYQRDHVIPRKDSGLLYSDIENDILKIAVVNRYTDIWPAMGFIKNFGLKKGAIASSVGHDSHNILAVGVDEDSICRVVNMIIEAKGGIAATDGVTDMILRLPVAGIMSVEDGYDISKQYKSIDAFCKEDGKSAGIAIYDIVIYGVTGYSGIKNERQRIIRWS